LVINNEKLREVYGDLKLSEAFSRADDVLATAAKGIAEIITVHGYINVDFADVETVMTKSGVAIMGSASASGEGRAIKAIQNALSSPLLNNNDITGAKSILLNITSGVQEISMDEVGEITDFVHQSADRNALIIWGTSQDERLGESVSVTVIATGFETNSIPELYTIKKQYDKIPLRDGALKENSEYGQRGGFEIRDKESHNSVVQTSIEFTIRDGEENEQFVIYDDKLSKKNGGTHDAKKREERVKKLKETHEKLKEEGYNGISSNDKIDELENQPAYLRKKVKLEDEGNRPSADNPVSRYSLSEDENNVPRLREDNSYLHDNVD
jgi:cell division protein FtsZ